MIHGIDPKVDCVFKRILGNEENKNLLIHFLNAVLEPELRIRDVSIMDPYNEREFIGDKGSIVDVKASDEKGRKYQIEIQLSIHATLTSRMLYTWSSIYHSQIKAGKNYSELKPVISVWIVDGNLFPDTEACHTPFEIYDRSHNIILSDHLKIHVLQLPKWKQEKSAGSEMDRWIYLFREGQNIDTDNLPEILNTKEMRKVMNILQGFSENQKDYLLYQSSLEAMYERNTWVRDAEESRKREKQAEKKAALEEKRRKQAEKEKRQAEKEKKQVEKEKKQVEKEKKQVEKEKKLLEEKLRQMEALLQGKMTDISDDGVK
ncbi:MAG: Rpn family recombination-promoting nuclease/putative transposase [Desulfococcaceae bacterium]|jgi:predicted transposase/invertase (TIGR01784 family)|nr:Rpn family recombination-promoting nuclease/putative transposase [Desulfococcaceae bacterium]